MAGVNRPPTRTSEHLLAMARDGPDRTGLRLKTRASHSLHSGDDVPELRGLAAHDLVAAVHVSGASLVASMFHWWNDAACSPATPLIRRSRRSHSVRTWPVFPDASMPYFSPATDREEQ